ncbi:unnamed protein product, partial [Mesorhabditis spiculigera]
MKLAYKILYCHGLGSSTTNRTAQFLTKYFAGTGNYVELFNYRNPGSHTKPWRISEWREDIENRIKDDEWILIASSAGAHCAINATISRPKNVKGLFLFSPGSALDLRYIETVQPGAKKTLEAGGSIIHPASRNGHEALVDLVGLKQFMETCASRREGSIPIDCPISILHGDKDPLVPHKNTIRLAEKFSSQDVELKIVPGGSHFLEMTPETIAFFERFLARFSVVEKKRVAAKI